ncbi:MAG: hypothetical protein AB1705_02650 [Verrucomicrobiota bacterium]
MRCFGLYPDQVAQRLQSPVQPPDLNASVLRGAVGFALVSLAPYAIWAFAGKWMYQNIGEAGLYLVCAVVFIALTGVALSGLVVGGSLLRFYALFGAAFAAYALAWSLAWFGVKGRAGEWVGSLAGTTVMGLLITCAFGARKAALPVILLLFVTHSVGYFLGGYVYEANGKQHPIGAKLGWGLCYGVWFGVGIGYAFYAAQEGIRQKLKEAKT